MRSKLPSCSKPFRLMMFLTSPMLSGSEDLVKKQWKKYTCFVEPGPLAQVRLINPRRWNSFEMPAALQHWIIEQLKKFRIHHFSYIVPISNIETVLLHGILPKNRTEKLGLKSESFALESCQQERDRKDIFLSDKNKHNVHDCVPLYITPLTPTLYKLKEKQKHLAIILVNSFILAKHGIFYAFSDGNMASHVTTYKYDLSKLDQLDWAVLRARYWADRPDGSRKRCAEFLISPGVPTSEFYKILTNNTGSCAIVDQAVKCAGLKIPSEIDHSYFFPG